MKPLGWLPSAESRDLRASAKRMRLLMAFALMCFGTGALGVGASAQANMDHTPKAGAEDTAKAVAEKTEAQKSFEGLKGLAGKWTGAVKVTPPAPDMDGTKVEITMRITSRGNSLVHEMQAAGTPVDPTKYDHPVTMLYLDGKDLTLVHYCDAGNRPRMIGQPSADGKKVEFEFADLSGGNDYGHMYHAVFTFVDANHHSEDWTFMMPGDKPMQAHMDLVREP
jgi:hypothetical protein